MQILQKVPLSKYSTMRLGGVAAYAAEVPNRQTLSEALAWARDKQLPLIMVGDGSNIVWKDEGFGGLLLINKIKGYQLDSSDEANQYLTIGSGENWDIVVERTVKAGLTGIEALSLIPGTAGATPVQNVGAYGQEISQTLISLEAYDTKVNQFVTVLNEACGFGYRTSRFKTKDHGRFFITAVKLKLKPGSMAPPFYPSLDKYLSSHNIKDYSPQSIRQAVINIRNSKLPDPKHVANNGSFFANPIVPQGQLAGLLKTYPEIVSWPTKDGQVKISAAWLVEQAGFKDYHDRQTGMATWTLQALVFVNEHAKNTADLLKFKQKIISSVEKKYGITLVQEPELLP